MLDQSLRRIFEDAGWIAVSIPNDESTWHVLRVLINAGKLHRERVGQAHVPIRTIHKDGIVRCHIVNQLMRGELSGSPALVVPIAIQDPFAFRPASCEFSDFFPEFLRTGSLMQLHARDPVATHIEMNMSVVETGNDTASLKVNHFCLGTCQLENCLAVTNLDDAIALDGDRLGFRLPGIPCPDFAVYQDEINVGLS